MIILVHDNHTIVKLYSKETATTIDYHTNNTISRVLLDVASAYPKELIIWVHHEYEALLNSEAYINIFHHKRIMASFSVNQNYKVAQQIGYVEHKPYTNVNSKVSFPTWLMSSDVGGCYATILNTIKNHNLKTSNFELFLTSLAKRAMPKGLFCYSEPALIKTINKVEVKGKTASRYELFKFVKQHYKLSWSLNLLACFICFENKWPLLSFFRSLFVKTVQSVTDLTQIQIASNTQLPIHRNLDVIIPTLGRAACLYDVLKDLAEQSIKPKHVIIVEQNPDITTKTELQYIKTEDWPFNIKHHFTHQTGACNARNIAIDLVESDWVFFADDDIRFNSNLIENVFNTLDKYGNNALNLLCLQPNDKQSYFLTIQTDIFGSGTSIVNAALLKNIKFDMAYEFGFGEDADFGMQIRHQGTDVIFTPDIKINHLKAPIGGFRTKIKKDWEDEVIQPKPSPTVMLFLKKHFNSFQRNGYKYVLFIKHYKNQKKKNPWAYIKDMKTQWDASVKWANNIQLKHETK